MYVHIVAAYGQRMVQQIPATPMDEISKNRRHVPLSLLPLAAFITTTTCLDVVKSRLHNKFGSP